MPQLARSLDHTTISNYSVPRTWDKTYA